MICADEKSSKSLDENDDRSSVFAYMKWEDNKLIVNQYDSFNIILY
jgi:hypothetical protein